jgi:hypothetical protein
MDGKDLLLLRLFALTRKTADCVNNLLILPYNAAPGIRVRF